MCRSLTPSPYFRVGKDGSRLVRPCGKYEVSRGGPTGPNTVQEVSLC